MEGDKEPPGGRSDPQGRGETSSGTDKEVANPGSKYVTIRIPKWLFWMLITFIIGLKLVLIAMITMRFIGPSREEIANQLIAEMGVDSVVLFRQHDRDDDGFLSMEEFEPLAGRLLEINETFEYDVPINDTDQLVTVQTFFEPLNLSTMSKEMDSTIDGVIDVISNRLDSLAGLKNWKTANKPFQNFAVKEFKAFMPEAASDFTALGKVYDIIVFSGNDMALRGATLSSNRYLPPKVRNDKERTVHRLLHLFHSRPFLHQRFGPQGSVATVRAYNDDYIDIVFRIHAEFQINDPPFHPFWFTPAQFTGNLIISRDGERLMHFKMYVPNERRLNVDMEWLNGPREAENMEVDIGYMPSMELRITAPSIPALDGDEDLRETYVPVVDPYSQSGDITWTHEISMDEAMGNLEKKLYPFKQVPYLNFTTAFPQAAAENKLVHSIILWGALDDQSC